MAESSVSLRGAACLPCLLLAGAQSARDKKGCTPCTPSSDSGSPRGRRPAWRCPLINSRVQHGLLVHRGDKAAASDKMPKDPATGSDSPLSTQYSVLTDSVPSDPVTQLLSAQY